ncbi:MAG: EAL domain-containing protein [Solirubrobacterales bacterium]|nr:EAL domain-containing protein [Solirubrobacterales bacterium]
MSFDLSRSRTGTSDADIDPLELEAARVELGRVLAARAADVARAALTRTKEDDPQQAIVFDLATEVVGRWLATGEGASNEEMAKIIDRAVIARGSLSVKAFVNEFLSWRRQIFSVLEEEAGHAGISDSLLHAVCRVVSHGLDISLLRSCRQFDEERERLAAELSKEQAKLAHDAVHDALTGLPNRTLLRERLAHALAGAQRHQELVAALFIDLDGFKAVNDGLGHDAGDKMLCEVARRLSRIVRDTDTLARLGGDELVIVCERLTSRTAAVATAVRALDAISEPYIIDGREAYVSASIGIALNGRSQDAEALIADADAAMYLAKQRGGSRYELYADEMRQAVSRRATLVQHLRRAVQQDEIEVHYQPVNSVADSSVISFEALARWTHPELGEVSPLEFIPLAEETGLIRALDCAVLQRACHQGAQWRELGWEVGISVNVSPTHLSGPSLERTVRSVLIESGLPASALTLEITESGLIKDIHGMVDALDSLARVGVKLALDDFGVGGSSFSYIQLLPVSAIKLDRSFVRDLVATSRTSSVVEAIVAFAHTLGLAVVAEGVESEEVLDEVRRLRCQQFQGFLVAPPAPAEAIRSLPEPSRARAAGSQRGEAHISVASSVTH